MCHAQLVASARLSAPRMPCTLPLKCRHALYSRASAATTPPSRPAPTAADSRGALPVDKLEVVVAVVAAVVAAVAPVALVVAVVPEELEELEVVVAEAEAAVVEVAAVASVAVETQLTTAGTVTPWAAHSCDAKVMAELWSAALQPPGWARQQAIWEMKSLSEQMHLGSVPQLPMPPVRNLLAQDCWRRGGRCQ